MDILKLIKERRTIRKYSHKPIPKKVIDKIIETGIWAPSIHGFQPWTFVVITNKAKIQNIANILTQKSKIIGTGPNVLMSSTADTISNAPTIIAIYNTKTFSNLAKRFSKRYVKIAKSSEVQAIGAVIQNILLTASVYKIGGCWTIIPLFCEKEINKILNTNTELMAIITLGYPIEKGKRASRKQLSKIVKYIY